MLPVWRAPDHQIKIKKRHGTSRVRVRGWFLWRARSHACAAPSARLGCSFEVETKRACGADSAGRNGRDRVPSVHSLRGPNVVKKKQKRNYSTGYQSYLQYSKWTDHAVEWRRSALGLSRRKHPCDREIYPSDNLSLSSRTTVDHSSVLSSMIQLSSSIDGYHHTDSTGIVWYNTRMRI